jgi:tetratricopeptide (TPR) repeat protein
VLRALSLFLGSALLTITFTGCATAPRIVVPYTGDPVIDGNANLAAAPERDKALWGYRVAAAALRRGQTDEAKARLDEALARSAAALTPGAEAAKSRKLFGREETKPFAGEPYERIMGNYYRGLLYWRDGEPDNARALFRSGLFIDSDTENKTYSGDWVLLDYLDGLVSKKLGGDGSDALARARASALAQGRATPPDYDASANVLIFTEYGPGPKKYASGEYGELLKFIVDDSPVASARLSVDGREIPLPPYDDISWQATTRGGRVMDHILGNKAVFKQRSETLGDVALVGALGTAAYGRSKDSANVALGLAAIGVLSKITSAATQTEADVRSWNNLPRYLSFGAVRLSPGDYPATLTFYNSTGRALTGLAQSFTIHVPAPEPTAATSGVQDIVLIRSELRD